MTAHLSIAVPLMDELDNLDNLLDCLRAQRYNNFTTYFCVNQPESWHSSDDLWQRQVVENNRLTIERLSQTADLDIVVIDRSSKGFGWTEKRKGVGWARKVLMERISAERGDDEIIVSLDADTRFDADYFASVVGAFDSHPLISAIAVPYYHPLTGDEIIDRRLLRYECYMRHYMINMLEIGSSYAFTALGSAMAFTVAAYKKAGGITPLQGGEDFYLMQKFVKTGTVMVGGEDVEHLMVRPQGRISQRVPFGTGPAVAMTITEQKQKYPFYKKEGFELVKDTFERFGELYDGDVETPMTAFLKEQLKTDDLWSPLRRNFKTKDLFVRACKEKVDGLRILQFLRTIGGEEPLDFEKEPMERIEELREGLAAGCRQRTSSISVLGLNETGR
ncbi:MAG: hypothetical protein J5711_00375 [Bacteroidales bacterium]|nr:hypothetical protein [Bacteroidales bacterium]